MRNIIDRIDEWLLARHQAAADWAYTLWDVSPYQIAAQIFGAVAGLLIVREGVNAAVDGIISRMPWMLFSPFTLLFSALYWRIAQRAHESWKSGRIVWTPARMPIIRVFVGWMFFALAVVSFPLVLAAVDWPHAVITAALMLGNLASVLGLYWLACNAPTKRQRREVCEQPSVADLAT